MKIASGILKLEELKIEKKKSFFFVFPIADKFAQCQWEKNEMQLAFSAPKS